MRPTRRSSSTRREGPQRHGDAAMPGGLRLGAPGVRRPDLCHSHDEGALRGQEVRARHHELQPADATFELPQEPSIDPALAFPALSPGPRAHCWARGALRLLGEEPGRHQERQGDAAQGSRDGAGICESAAPQERQLRMNIHDTSADSAPGRSTQRAHEMIHSGPWPGRCACERTRCPWCARLCHTTRTGS